ncbi:MAG: hypothetical protein IJU84_09100 [Clostridia bacterium]|nr:hypothetical protein [Clostridia bacterium]
MIKTKNIFALLFSIAILACFNVKAFWAEAGTSGVYVEDGSVFQGQELSISEWYFDKSAGVALEEVGGASTVALKTKDAGKIFTSRTAVTASEEIEECLYVTIGMSIKSLLEGRKFGFVFGSPALLGNIDAAGTTFLWFENSGNGFNYGLKRFGTGGESVLVSESYISSDTASELAIEIAVSGGGRINFNLNGEPVYSSSKDGEVSAEGYLGFAQDGKKSLSSNEKTEIYITDLNIVNRFYNRPENPLVVRADFSGNMFNTEEWHLQSKASVPNGGIFVDDGALRFDGSGQNGFFGTNYQYSNFVLEYDLFDVKTTVTTENDGWVNGVSYWQGVEFGIDGDISATSSRNEGIHYLVYFSTGIDNATGERTSDDTKMGFIAKGKYITTSVALPDKYSMFKEGFEGKVRVRLSVIDGKMKVSLKLVEEYGYTDIFSYEFANGYTPFGYVSLHGEGNQFTPGRQYYGASYFTLDNIQIVNYDKKPNTVKIGFESNIVEPTKDYPYINTWTDDYLVIFTKGKGRK